MRDMVVDLGQSLEGLASLFCSLLMLGVVPLKAYLNALYEATNRQDLATGGQQLRISTSRSPKMDAFKLIAKNTHTHPLTLTLTHTHTHTHTHSSIQTEQCSEMSWRF